MLVTSIPKEIDNFNQYKRYDIAFYHAEDIRDRKASILENLIILHNIFLVSDGEDINMYYSYKCLFGFCILTIFLPPTATVSKKKIVLVHS